MDCRKVFLTAFYSFMLACGICAGADEAAAEKPAQRDTEAMLKEAVEKPAVFAELISDAKIEECVNYFVQIVGGLEALKLDNEDKTTRIAVMTAYMFKRWSTDAKQLAEKLAESVTPELLAPVVAAAAVVMGNQAPLITDAFVSHVPESYAQTLRNCGAHPETVLPQGLLVSIGLPVPHSVPATGREPTALPVAPPLRIEGGQTDGEPPPAVTPPRTPPAEPPPPPPVPPVYKGQ